MNTVTKSNNQSISKQIFIRMFLVVTLLTILPLGYFVFYEFKKFEQTTTTLKDTYYREQKNIIKTQVNNAYSSINYEIENYNAKLNNKLSNRVNLAFQIATDIYAKNKGNSSNEQIIHLITEALGPIKFDNGRGSFFSGNLDELNNIYFYHIDLEQNAKLVKSFTDGQFISHKCNNHGEGDEKDNEKISYIKTFEQLNLYIATSECIDVFTKEIQNEILDKIAKMRFGKEGYIFVNTYDGYALITDGEIVTEERNLWDLEDPNGIKVIQEERSAVRNPEGDYIYYVWNKLTKTEPAAKISFIRGIPDWQWMIGAGVYVDEVEEEIKLLNIEHQDEVKKNIIRSITLISIIYLLLFLIIRRLSGKIDRNVKRLSNFFINAKESLYEIDKSDIQFIEFSEIADSANSMIRRRIAAENKLKIETKHFEKLFENVPVSIMIIDKNSFINKLNKTFKDTFQVNNEELIGKPFNDSFTLFQNEDFVKFVTNIQENATSFIQLFHKDKIFSVAGTLITLDSEYLGTYLLFHDITKEIRIQENLKFAKEKAEESDLLKSRFLANMSHEIRTPMNGILGFTQILKYRMRKEQNIQYLKIIEESSIRMLSIINDIMDISKIESGQVEINLSNVSLHEIFDKLFNFFKLEVDEKGIKLIYNHTLHSKNDIIYTDESKLIAILTNLLKNAIKFTSKGTIEFGYLIEENNILFSVKDTGKGIAKEKESVIFNRFVQANMEIDKVYEGSGLGLAISKAYVEKLGGKIWLESEKGCGSKFYFTLPIKNNSKI